MDEIVNDQTATENESKGNGKSRSQSPKRPSKKPLTTPFDNETKKDENETTKLKETLTLKPSREVVAASPSTRRFAREIGVDISQVLGSGPGGRISIDDVKGYSKKLNSGVNVLMSSTAALVKPLPDFAKWGEIQFEPVNNIRAKTAENLSYAWSTIPHVTQF